MYDDIITFKTDIVPVFDVNGNKIHEVHLPEAIIPLPGKRTGVSEEGVFYKGAGIVYQKHLVNQYDESVRLLDNTKIIYEKYMVCYPHLIGKYGVFNFPHQAIFTDLEGGCGKKEENILNNHKLFELSAIEEITNVISVGISNGCNIYSYRLKNVMASPLDIINLIEYVLLNNYNTAWDKNLWADIYCYQYVRDIADWFVSDQLCYKLGTVYALLNSLYNNDIYLYTILLKNLLGISNSDKIYIIYFSACIVYKYCSELFEVDLGELTPDLYEMLLKQLFKGKACCHLENDEEWQWVREYYLDRIGRYVTSFQGSIARKYLFKN